jgi:hypothetical protein
MNGVVGSYDSQASDTLCFATRPLGARPPWQLQKGSREEGPTVVRGLRTSGPPGGPSVAPEPGRTRHQGLPHRTRTKCLCLSVNGPEVVKTAQSSRSGDWACGEAGFSGLTTREGSAPAMNHADLIFRMRVALLAHVERVGASQACLDLQRSRLNVLSLAGPREADISVAMGSPPGSSASLSLPEPRSRPLQNRTHTTRPTCRLSNRESWFNSTASLLAG